MSIKNAVLGMGITGVVIASSLTVNIAPAVSQTPNPDKVTFLCTKIYDSVSGKKIPATLVWMPENKEHRQLIGWKSQYFDKEYTPEKRCQIVTKKFQEKYDSGNLDYLIRGTSKGYPIICGVKNIDDPCDQDSQLFTLKKHNNSEKIKEALIQTLNKASGMIMQSSGNTPVPFADVLKNASVVKK